MSEEKLTMTTDAAAPSGAVAVEQALERAVTRLENTRAFAKSQVVAQVLEVARRLLMHPEGIPRLYHWAGRLDAAGVFNGTDWDQPGVLLPSFVKHTLEHGDRQTVVIECLSLLRMLAIAKDRYTPPGVSSEQAHHFLTQVLAHNLRRVFQQTGTEAERRLAPELQQALDALFQFLAGNIGYGDIFESLCQEIWRILAERPIQVFHAKAMITQIAVSLADGVQSGDSCLGADRLISALFGPTQASRDDPGLALFRERLEAMDAAALRQEAFGFARAMHDVGLVSDYHAELMRWLAERKDAELIADALGLSSTGRDGLRCYQDLTLALIDRGVFPETSQAVYGLAMLLERGIIYMPSIAPNLWRQTRLRLTTAATAALQQVFGTARPAQVYLLAGVISVLGQPLGVGQGNNPTCQAARAISMWSLINPDYLLELITQAATFDRVLMHFEGEMIDSSLLASGLMLNAPMDNDPVSTLLVPHLDRIYLHMGRLCAQLNQDPHQWINPEFHGWWVGREFAIAVDINTGVLIDYETFIRHFFASYHPYYNGNQPVVYPQPAGLAVTDSSARFVGWHAITLLRVALDQSGVMRVYFYNPNNDSGQNWGNDVVVSTHSNGERYGESSLPFNELASRLYIFHDEPLTTPPIHAIPDTEVEDVRDKALASWARFKSASGEG